MRRDVLVAGVVVIAVSGLVACSTNQNQVAAPTQTEVGLGVVKGSLPLCGGPSGQNLTPTLVVVASVNGETKASAQFDATTADHAYELSLPAGVYDLHAGDWPSTSVVVKPGASTVVDLPGGGCL
jgi:hypothetical protein